jgi:acyl-CoA thioester hydrolase
MEADGFALPVVEAHCDYRQSAKYDDELEIVTTAAIVSPVRVKFEYQIVRAKDAATLAGGHTVHASLDTNGKPRRLPDRIRSVLPVLP